MAEESVLAPVSAPENKVHKSNPSPSDPLSPIIPNPRSCITCRRRKVKCDKKHPCNHCTRQDIECVYPPPGRAPRRLKKPQDAALVERLRRLEAVVQTLSTNSTTEEESSTVSPRSEAARERELQEAQSVHNRIKNMKREWKELMGTKKEQRKRAEENMDDLTERFGTLLVQGGRSRYINPGFWSMFNAEVQELKGDIEGWSDSEEEEEVSLAPADGSAMHGFMFGFNSISVQMSLLHPASERVHVYWETYCENVDPMLKMIHRHTRQPHILGWANSLDNLSSDAECTLFAIYYAAVSSTWPEDCRQKFGESKQDLLARYRFGMEQALARANFLQTDSIFVLQSFIVFLTCLRRQADTRALWSLSALLVRIAQGLGLHRDGAHYPNLPLYKQEMRRMIWWHTIVLDMRLCEDLASDAGLHGRMWDTKMPRNLNDLDISFEMTTLPESRQGCTDMTFNVVRFEIGQGFARVLKGMNKHIYLQYTIGTTADVLQEGLEKRRNIILDLEKRLNDDYLQYADPDVPINYMTIIMSRMLLAKLWLMLYQPFQKRDEGEGLSQETRDMLFVKSLECIELYVTTHTEARTPRFYRFSWLMQTYTPWHGIAFLLSELCVRTIGEDVEKAWHALDYAFDMPWSDATARAERPDAHLWKPLRILRRKARAMREDALMAMQASSNDFTFRNADSAAVNATTAWPTDDGQNGFLPDLTSTNLDGTARSSRVDPTEAFRSLSPIGFKGAVIPSQNKNRHDAAPVGIAHPHNTLSVINPQLPAPQSVTTPGDWMGTTGTAMSGVAHNPGQTGDSSIAWEAWDDLVAQWGFQNEDFAAANGMNQMY